ncbi:MAG: hypothetical protein L0I76_32630 [Pseudonocardia sp.]|nr:hypothetical protein [Pseudonocardia sp.]
MRTGTAAAVIVGALALVLLLVTAWAARERAEFAPRPFSDVDAALAAGGIAVCAVADAPDPYANQAVASRTLTIASDCAASDRTGDRAQVLVDRFDDVDDRDAAVRAHEVLLRPRGSGVSYTFGELSLLLRGDTPTVERAGDALTAAGAR